MSQKGQDRPLTHPHNTSSILYNNRRLIYQSVACFFSHNIWL